MNTTSTRAWLMRGAVVVAVAAALFFAFRPQPIPADLATVEHGPLSVTLDDDGETRVREVYQVSAPFPGRVLRFRGDVGDRVSAGETVLAEMQPAIPALLDARTRAQREAAVEAAVAARSLAAADLGRIEAEAEFAEMELRRKEKLGVQGAISASDLDRARKEAQAAGSALQTARAALEMSDHELATTRAAVMPPSDRGTVGRGLPVRAPVSGTILRIFRESEGVVPAGAPLAEIGDPADLEVVVDLLSSDAVLVSAGDRARIERWGGERSLEGVVRRVEPYGVTKISALGVEEQRVNVRIDLVDPFEEWQRLGHGFRVEARIVLWHEDDVLRVPVAALFRRRQQWAVFTVEEGRARLARVQIGRTNGRFAQVLAGLEVGDRVIVYPSDRVTAGATITPREPMG